MKLSQAEYDDLLNRIYGAWGIIEVCIAQLDEIRHSLLTTAPAASPQVRKNLQKAAEKDFWAVSTALQSAQIIMDPLKPFIEDLSCAEEGGVA